MTPLEARCIERGLRITEHRRIVFAILDGSDDHPCAREIHRRAADGRRIGIATVYRTLNTLVEAGMVKRHVFADGRAHYQRAGRPSHPHLMDLATGRIVEIDDAGLRPLLDKEARRHGYRLVDYSLKLFVQPQG